MGPRWSGATARWTGGARRASTRAARSRGCSTPRPGTGRSVRSARSRSSVRTCRGRWCCAPPSTPRAGRWRSPTRWRSGRARADTTWVRRRPMSSCGWSRPSTVWCRSRWSSSPDWSTASCNQRSCGALPACRRSAARTRCCSAAIGNSMSKTAGLLAPSPCAGARAQRLGCTTAKGPGGSRRARSTRAPRWRTPRRRGGRGPSCMRVIRGHTASRCCAARWCCRL